MDIKINKKKNLNKKYILFTMPSNLEGIENLLLRIKKKPKIIKETIALIESYKNNRISKENFN